MGFLDRWRKGRGASGEGMPAPGVGCLQIAECAPRRHARIHGKVTAVADSSSSFAATLVDETGQIELVWSGRGPVGCIEIGSAVTAEGTVGTGRDGRARILDPKFTVMAGE